MQRLSLWKSRWLIVFTCIMLYVTAYVIHLHNANSWIPDAVVDTTLTKKNADGPLILRDDLFDNGAKSSKLTLRGAGIMGNVKELFDQPLDPDMPDFDSGSIKKVGVAPSPPLNVSSKFLKKFQNYAKKAAKNSDNFVLFTVINEGYYNLTSNILCNLYAIDGVAIHKKIFIVALQHETCAKLTSEWPKIQCISMESDAQHNRDVEWGKKVYVQILAFRAQLLHELAKMRIRFVLFEADAIWFRSPFDLIRNMTSVDDADVIIPVNGYPGKQTFAFDPLVAFNTTAALSLFEEMRSRLERDPNLLDQEVLNELCSSQHGGVVCRNFDWADVADGKWFKLSDRERRQFHPFIVNNNYYVGVKNKAARQAINGLWFLSPKGHCNMSKAKKLLAKHRN